MPVARIASRFMNCQNAGDVLLQLPVDDERSVDAEVAHARGRVIGIVERWQSALGVEIGRHDRRWRHDAVVIRVPEDELAGGHSIAADAGN